jgi:hypothetical protein
MALTEIIRCMVNAKRKALHREVWRLTEAYLGYAVLIRVTMKSKAFWIVTQHGSKRA